MKDLMIVFFVGVLSLLISCNSGSPNAESSMPDPSSLGNPNFNPTEQRFVIIPAGRMPLAFLTDLRQRLEKIHSEKFLISTEMGLREEWTLPGQEQYNSNILAYEGLAVFERLSRPKAYCILLTDRDINYPGSGFRFVFSAEYTFGVSVVSIARMNPRSYGVGPNVMNDVSAYELLMERTIKIINKELGKGYHKYPVTGDIESVMYGPIMSVDDVDRMGTWY